MLLLLGSVARRHGFPIDFEIELEQANAVLHGFQATARLNMALRPITFRPIKSGQMNPE